MRTGVTAGFCGLVASLALASSAFAANVEGTNGGDRLSGTGSAAAPARTAWRATRAPM